jgi:hypothetical protein
VLFIDQLPLHAVGSGPLAALTASLPIVPSDPTPTEQGTSRPPPLPRGGFQRWVVDSGYRGEAFAWRHHLEAAGLNVRDFLNGSATLVGFQRGRGERLPLRNVDLWLFSNIPALQYHPFQITLSRGVAFRNVDHLLDPESNCPLVGMGALVQAGLRVQLDCATRTVSVWIPGRQFRGLLQGIGGLVSRRWRGKPVSWERV